MPSLPFIARTSNSMMGSVATRTAQAVRPHVPLIKFPPRNAVNAHEASSSGPVPNPARPTAASQKTTSKATAKGSTIDSSGLPLRFQRKPISKEEMEHIEKGGPV